MPKYIKAVILGVGSELRGDDAAGVLVARKLQEKNIPNLVIIDGGTAPENFTGEIRRHKPSHLIIIDSAVMGEKPGTIKLISKEEVGGYTFTTHALPLNIMVDFILADHKCEIMIIGIEPKSTGFSLPVSPEAAKAIDDIALTIETSIMGI